VAESLRRGWYTQEIRAADLPLAGIYLWTIVGVGVYIGQARQLQSRVRQYPNNVRKLLANLPYRKAKPYNYRDIHRELAKAHTDEISVTVSVLETCHPSALNKRERYWIDRLRAEAERGGPRVLNSN
jgi:hypothetical protein